MHKIEKSYTFQKMKQKNIAVGIDKGSDQINEKKILMKMPIFKQTELRNNLVIFTSTHTYNLSLLAIENLDLNMTRRPSVRPENWMLTLHEK